MPPNYGASTVLEAVLSVAIGSYTTQPSLTAATVCVCWMLGTGNVLMDGGREELEQRKRGQVEE